MNAVAKIVRISFELALQLLLLICAVGSVTALAAVCPPRPVDCVAYSQISQSQSQSPQRVCVDQALTDVLALPNETSYLWIAPGVPVSLLGSFSFDGTLVNCGELSLPEVTAGSGFLFRNYANATIDSPWLFNGAAEVVNYSQGVLQFSVPINLKEGAKIVNDGQLISLATLQTDPGTELLNKGFLNIIGGNFDPNGDVDNQGFIETNRFININGQSNVVNNCKFIADQGFNNNSPRTQNNGYVFVGSNALLQMNADFHQGENGFVVGAHFLSSGAITGAGAYHFTGDTRSQGTFGLDGQGINFYDATSTAGRIFDFQGLPPHASVTRNYIEPPLADGIAPRCSPELVDHFPVITISPIAGDDVLSLSEDDSPLAISGTAMHVENGQPVSVTLAREVYRGVVFAGVWSVTIPAAIAAQLPQNNQVIANVTNAFGEPAQPAMRNFVHLQPMPKITIATVAGDDVVNATEDNFPVIIRGSTLDVEDQQVVTVRVNGQLFEAMVLNNAWQTEIPASVAEALPASTTIAADVMTRSGVAAPQATRTIAHTVNLPAIMILPIAGDDIISLAEDDSDIEINGITANVESGQLVTVSVAGERFTTRVNTNEWSLLLPATVAQDLPATNVFNAEVANTAGDSAVPATRTVAHIQNRPELTISAVTGDDYVNTLESLAPVVLEGFALHINDGLMVDIHIALTTGDFSAQAAVVNSRWRLELPLDTVSQLDREFRVQINGENHVGDAAQTVTRLVKRAIAPDTDGDGLPDVYEGTGDFDQDGIADYLDTDSDNDGIGDRIEGLDSFSDINGNGIIDVFDALITGGPDFDFNDVDDNASARDFDGDGQPDFKDFDSDNDSLTDAIEGIADIDSDGISNYHDLDSDGDGIADALEGQVVNGVALDSDQDGLVNFIDTDSDNDGLTDQQEAPTGTLVDSDNDGIADAHDSDSDNDGLSDAFESGWSQDDDNDGIANHADADFNSGHYSDSYWLDIDGDGIADGADSDVAGAVKTDLNSDGIADSVFWRDSDGDGIADFLDIDSDNDGLPDADEIGGYLLPSVMATGRIVANELAASGALYPRDSDGDGFYDHLDLDSDNDGLSDAWESDLGMFDPDGDGHIGGNIVIDNNGDGWPDIADPRVSNLRAAAVDSNFDGIPDRLSLDSDSDGRFDNAEILGQDFANIFDSNNDGVLDLGIATTLANGEAERQLIAPVFTSAEQYPVHDANNNLVDDGIEQYLQLLGIYSDVPGEQDFDRDGYLDVLEIRFGGNPLDGAEPDSNGDGIPDWTHNTDINGSGSNDSDGDGIYDVLESITGLDLGAADNNDDAFNAIEQHLLNTERYSGRSAEPVVWIEASQVGQFISVADNLRAITLHARQGNYHVYNEQGLGSASEKPQFEWFNQLGERLGTGQNIELAALSVGEHQFYLTVQWQGQQFHSAYRLRVAGEAARDNDRDGVADIFDNHHAELGYLQTLYSTERQISAVNASVALEGRGKQWRDRAVRLRNGFYSKNYGEGFIHFNPELLGTSYLDGKNAIEYDGIAQEKTIISRMYAGPAYHVEVVNLPYVGAEVAIAFKLARPIPSKALLHQWQSDDGDIGRWHDNFNVYSSASINGQCTELASDELTPGLKASFDCLHLMIADGGFGDADGKRNGSVEILMGISGESAEREKGAITTGVAGGAMNIMWVILVTLLVALRSLPLERMIKRTACVSPRRAGFVACMVALCTVHAAQAAPKKCEGSSRFDAQQGGFECSGFYLGFGGLAASLTPKITNVPEMLVEDSYGLGIYGYAGYDINAYWSLEGHYSDQGHAVFNSGAKIRYRYAGYSALFHLTNHLPAFNVYAKTGIGWLETNLDQGRDDNVGFAFNQENDQQIHWGLGATLQSTGGLGIRAEYLWVDQDSQQISLSIIKRFGRAVKPVSRVEQPTKIELNRDLKRQQDEAAEASQAVTNKNRHNDRDVSQ